MKKCPSCGAVNEDVSKFCSSCGKKLAGKTICPYCNKEVKPNDKYCRSCGRSLKQKVSKKQEYLETSQKKKLSRKARIAVIVSCSFIGFLVLAVLGLFLFTNFYLAKKYSLAYGPDGSLRLVSACSGPSFGELEISSEIDKQTFKPLKIQDKFETGFREVFATIYVSGVSLDDEFSFKWKEAGADEYIIDFKFRYFFTEGYMPNYISVPEEESIENYKIFNEPGDYIVEFYHNDEFIDDAGFKVVESNETAALKDAEYNTEGNATSNAAASDTAEATDAAENAGAAESYEDTEEEIYSESYSELWFGDLQTCEDLDKNNNMINSGVVFDYGITMIYAVIDVRGATKEDASMFKWISGATGDTVSTYWSKYYPEAGEEYFHDKCHTAIFLAVGAELEEHDILGRPGSHIVEFYHNGELIDSVIFEIK
jgi:hypothetical protein